MSVLIPGLDVAHLSASICELAGGQHATSIAEWLEEFETVMLPLLTRGDSVVFRHAPYLYCLLRAVRPLTVVETGVDNGESSLAMLAALHKNGRPGSELLSCDIGPPSPVYDRAFDSKVFPFDAWAYWHHRIITGVNLLKLIESEHGQRSIDVFFHDSDHRYDNQQKEYGLAYPLVLPGGFIGGDDAEWDNPPWAFHEMAAEHSLTPVPFGCGYLCKKTVAVV